MFKTNAFTSAAAIGAVAIAAAGVGYFARAQGPGGAVNPPGQVMPGGPTSFADIVSNVAPAVVSINVVEKAGVNPAALEGQGGDDQDAPDDQGGGEDQGQGQQAPQGLPFGFRFMVPHGQPANPQPIHASGSGFFISPDGYIVTNDHVVENAQKITVVTNDNRELPAVVVGKDEATDLAVVKVTGGPYRYVSFEDRAQPRVGDWVVAVGNPFGLGGTATAGIVSALGRQNVGQSSYVDYMQIDAPINRGNSGGPTFDVEGHVVGVNTAIYSPSGGSVGIGFDIPASVAAQVTHQLIASGQVTRGYIGATVQSLSPDLASSLGMTNNKGALVAQLTPGGPAEAAGLKPGDVVVGIDGRPVESSSDLTRQVATVHPGQALQLSVLRAGHPLALTLRAGLRPSEQALASNDQPGGGEGQGPNAGPAVLGMQVAPGPEGGLVIQGVAPQSDAASKGIEPGDLIIRAGEAALTAPADLAQAVAAARAEHRDSVPLLIARQGRRFYVPVEIAPHAAG